MEVYIRLLQEDDAKTSYAWRNDPEIWKYTGSRPDHVITLDDELNWIRKAMRDESARRFAIIADEVYVGNIYLTNIHSKQAEYHIFLGNKEYMGRGVAKQASKLIIDYARDELGLNVVTLQVRPENERAVQLYMSLGFVVTSEDEEFLNMSITL